MLKCSAVRVLTQQHVLNLVFVDLEEKGGHVYTFARVSDGVIR
jgi:hypothetical protein